MSRALPFEAMRDEASSYRSAVLRVLALCVVLSSALPAAHAGGAEAWPVERWAGDHRAAGERPLLPVRTPSRRWNVCAVYPHLKDSYWLAVNYGMVEEAHALGLGLRVLEAGGYTHLGRQRERVARCTQDPGNDALLVGTVSVSGLDDLLAPYNRSHPVLGLVNDIDPAVVRGRVGVPWYQLGWKIGRWLAGRHPAGGDPAEVAWLPGPQGADWVGFVDRGFMDAIDGSAVRIATVRWADTGRSVQRRLVEAVLDAHPRLDYLVGNAPMAEAAVAEVRRRRREGEVGIVASYLTPGVYGGILRGRILAAVTDFPVLQGRMAMRQALLALEGAAIEPYLGPAVELVEAESIGRHPIDWMLPPAGFVPVYEVAPTRP